MAQYVVNIAPVPGGEDQTGPVPEAIVHVDVEDGQVLVRELTIRAPQGTALATTEPSYADFELLLKAFAGSTPAKRSAEQRSAAPIPVLAGPTAPAADEASEEPEGKPATARAGRSGKATTSGKRAARSARPPRLGPGRAYRRAPAPEVLMAAYEQTGSIAGVAAKFGVPAHTAQGWISRLRQKAASQEPGS